MTSDDGEMRVLTERFERRLSEENGKLRVDMAAESGKVRVEMAGGFGAIRTELALQRAEIIERNNALLKWLLIFGVSQTAAIVGVIRLFR